MDTHDLAGGLEGALLAQVTFTIRPAADAEELAKVKALCALKVEKLEAAFRAMVDRC